MRLRTFGKTGQQVSEIGMGCMRFENPDNLDEMAEVVLHAHERGVTYFDTAPYYCKDNSEAIVGRAVLEMKKSGRPFQIASKTMAPKAADARKDLERSLQRLNVDAIDYYHVWCLVHEHQMAERIRGGILEEFQKFKQEGLIRHISVSTHLSHGQVDPMLEQSGGLFEGMLIGFNVINHSLRIDGIKSAARRGMGVVIMNSLGGGMLIEFADRFGAILRPGDASILDAALRFNLSHPEITVTLVGFRNKRDIDTAMEAYERIQLLTPAEMDEVKRNVTASSESFCTQCNYCDGCPVDIPVIRFMESYNRLLLKPEAPIDVLNNLKWHWGIPDAEKALEACTQCGQCAEACTQHLPILERFEEIRRMDRAEKARVAAEQAKSAR